MNRVPMRGKGPLGSDTYRSTLSIGRPTKDTASKPKAETQEFELKHQLKFAIRRRDGANVLSKWSYGKRSTWGESEQRRSPYSYEKGEVFLTTSSKWRELFRVYEKHGLPLDPDPITTIDIAFGILDPPKEEDYQHGYRILDIDAKQRRVTVVPVIRVPYDAITLPGETIPEGKKPKYKRLQLNDAKQVWSQAELTSKLIHTGLVRQLNTLGKAIEFTMQATIFVLDVASGGARASIGKAAKRAFMKKFKNLGSLVKLLKALDKPVGKALISFASKLSQELAKNQLIQSHFQANKKLEETNSIVIVASYKKNDPSFAKAMQQAIGAFAATFVEEALGEALAGKVAKDEFLRRRIKYTLLNGKDKLDIAEDVICAHFQKAVTEWCYKYFLTDRVTDVITIINNAATKSKNQPEFMNHLYSEFTEQFKKGLVDGLKTSLQTIAK